jgi:hypothetical protein
MIQRIQSIFLLLVAIAMGLMLAFDIWEKTSVPENEAVVLNTYFLTHYQLEGAATTPPVNIPVNIIEQQASWYLAILASLAAVVALYSIFRYDNRLMQIKLGALNSLLIGGTLIACLVLTINGEEMIANGEKGEYLIGFYLPAVGLIFNMLANRFIRKDEALVRSADRFR